MSFCKNCGAEVDGKFCSNCGQQVDKEQASSKDQQVPTEEIERFERIRLYEIETCEKEIEKISQEIDDLKSKFIVNKKKVAEKEEELNDIQETLRRLSHQTGYDLYIESKTGNKFLDKLKSIDSKKIGDTITTIGNFIPTPLARTAVKSTGKLIKSIKKK